MRSTYKSRKHSKLAVENLEVRQMMAANISASLSNRVLYVEGTEGSDTIVVRQVNGNLSIDRASVLSNGSKLSRISNSNVDRIEIRGLGGNDTILLNSEAVSGQQSIVKPSKIWGDAGNDSIVGTAVVDEIWGGIGNDKLWGSDGNDTLLGEWDNDELIGGYGDDQLNGGNGIDSMWGESGSDVLVSLDAKSADYLDGGTGRDTFWIDQISGQSDRIAKIESGEKVQSVGGFANGADRTLDGDRIADPVALTGQTYKRFSGNPLFSKDGPQATDVKQGNLGDCYALAGVAAIAIDNPGALKQNMVDLNDGTYAVRLGNSFYRVDNDLPVNNASDRSPAYAKLGADNSMWVAVVEKAFAHYRKGNNTYASIEGGWSVEINRAFGSNDAGAKSIQDYKNSAALATDVFNRWNTYQSVTIGFNGSKKKEAGDAGLILGHQYTVWSVKRNSAGTVTSIVLRNPWGTDGGDKKDSNPNDGLVTVTPDQIFRLAGQVNWGRV